MKVTINLNVAMARALKKHAEEEEMTLEKFIEWRLYDEFESDIEDEAEKINYENDTEAAEELARMILDVSKRSVVII